MFIDMREEKVLFNAVVCYLVKDSKILMAMKPETKEKERKIGEGYWNGYGGGIDPGETSRNATIREVFEETDEDKNKGIIISPEHLEKVAVIDFHNHKIDGEVFTCRVHFYFAYEWFGEAKDTSEMVDPTWFKKDQLPEKLMPADKHFLPIILEGKKIKVSYTYGPCQGELIGASEIEYFESLPED